MASKPDLTRAGTMEVTTKDGKAFLEKSLTDWKKPYLTEHLNEEDEQEEAVTEEEHNGEEEEAAATPAKKPKMSKHTTMKGTAKEAKQLLGGEKLADTRQETKSRKSKSPMKKVNTMAAAVSEAKVIYGELDISGGRQLRKRKAEATPVTPTKPGMKRAGTMQATAKDGKAFLKRSKKGGKGKK